MYELNWIGQDGKRRAEPITYGEPTEYIQCLTTIGATDIVLTLNGVEVDYNVQTNYEIKLPRI